MQPEISEAWAATQETRQFGKYLKSALLSITGGVYCNVYEWGHNIESVLIMAGLPTAMVDI